MTTALEHWTADANAAALMARLRAEPESSPLPLADWFEENDESDRGELIRVQVELAAVRCPSLRKSARCDSNSYCRYCEDRGVLIARRSALLRLAPSWCPLGEVPKCGVCGGDGKMMPGGQHATPCRYCAGTGSPVYLTWALGLPSLTVPAGVLCGERCEVCGGSKQRQYYSHSGDYMVDDCNECGGLGCHTPPLRLPAATVAALVGCRVSGREPTVGDGTRAGWWTDIDDPNDVGSIPRELFDRLEGGTPSLYFEGGTFFPTADAARRALDIAAWQVLVANAQG